MSVNAKRPVGTQPLGSQGLAAAGSRSGGSAPIEPVPPSASPLAGDAFKGSGQLEGARPSGGLTEKLNVDQAKRLIGSVRNIKPEMVATAGLAVAGTVAKMTGNNDAAATIEGAEASRDGVVKWNKLVRERGNFRNELRAFGEAKANGVPYQPKAAAVPDAKPLGAMVRVGAGIDVVRGGMSAINMSKSLVAAAKDPRKFTDPDFVRGIGRDVLTTLNGVGGVAQLAGKSGLAAKLNPIAGIASGAFGVTGAASDIAKHGLNWKNASELASQALNMAGSVAMLLPPAGPVVAAGLKVAAMGLDLIRYGIANKEKIMAGGKAAIKLGVQAASTAADFFRNPGATSKRVASAAAKEAGKLADAAGNLVGDGLKKAGSVLGGVKKLFGFGG
ncbi:MAG: hypothetical protein FJY99_06235 [Candidatus Sericytochromatia bacterium]|nr:hypothetical protein [Candidatus Tanganyikabacteria bacterium]